MTEQLLEAVQTDSTVIDQDIDAVKSGGGKPPIETPEKKEAPRKAESARESLEAEAKKISASTDDEDDEDDTVAAKKAPDDKTAKEVKPAEAKESEAKAKDGTEQEAKTPKPSEGRKIIEAPARLLPQNKELWKGVAHPIREEWVRREQEYETETAQLREHKAFRDDLKEFEDLAKSKGVNFKQALTNYVDIERKFSEDPAQGFRQIMQNTNMTPQQAIGHVLRAFNATPQQLVERITAAPHEFTPLAQRPAQQQQVQQPEPNPEIQELKKQLDSMRAEQLTTAVIAPFAQEYPEYWEKEDAIAKVLQSGIIEQIHGHGLSPRETLEAALFMVAPHTKRASSQSGEADPVRSQDHDDTAPAGDLRGGKSVKSSVGSVSDTSEPERRMSMRDMLEEEARKLSRRA